MGLGLGLQASSLAEVRVRVSAQRVYPLRLTVEVRPMAQRLLEVLWLAPAHEVPVWLTGPIARCEGRREVVVADGRPRVTARLRAPVHGEG